MKVLKPALGRIVLRNLKTEERSEGGIWLPGGKQVIGTVAEVVAVCDPYESDHGDGPMYEVGTVVVLGKYNGVDIEIGRDSYVVIREEDILGELVEKDEVSSSETSTPMPKVPLAESNRNEPEGYDPNRKPFEANRYN